MALPRCGVPDVNITFRLSETVDLSWPLIGRGWFPKHRTELTYGFYPASMFSQEKIKVFRDSFHRWSHAVGVVKFTETTVDKADIMITYFLSGISKLFGEEAVAATVMLKLSNYHQKIMFFDGSKYLAYPEDNLASINMPLWQFGVVDLETVAMHQIGHLLGLPHSTHNESVMYPSILPHQQRKVDLSKDDIKQIRKIYPS